ncbi:MAG: hypothetical protein JOZ18_09785 [Chloroflexi bacterium]|nr:hypothetical protein [Chloroflexota bacterium]
MTDDNNPNIPLETDKSSPTEDKAHATSEPPTVPITGQTPFLLPGQQPLPSSGFVEDTVAVNPPPSQSASPDAQQVFLVHPHANPPPGANPAVHEAPTQPYNQNQILPPPQSNTSMSGHRGRKFGFFSWLIAAVSCIAIAAMVLGLLVFMQPSLLSPEPGPQNNPQQPTPSPTQLPSPTPSSTVSTGNVTVIPNHFNVATDCQVDNGYRCTATLILSQDAQGSLAWHAFGNGVATKFSPAYGTLSPGQQQQVIIYLYNKCPYTGTVNFSVAGHNIAVPVRC